MNLSRGLETGLLSSRDASTLVRLVLILVCLPHVFCVAGQYVVGCLVTMCGVYVQ